ncbi:MAG: hypothetical protein B6V02_03500 [Thermoprotei archaeon ex4572_64]|nr:MAG: hypothetical protein B6V02_03500 [Thermoprotei archaeon ex4572_64]
MIVLVKKVLIILHGSRVYSTEDTIKNFIGRLSKCLEKIFTDMNIEYALLTHNLDDLKLKIMKAINEEKVREVLIYPLLVVPGTHYEDVRKLCHEISTKYGINIKILDPLIENEEFIRYVASTLVKEYGLDGISNDLSRTLILLYGDYYIPISIEMNTNMENIINAVRNVKFIFIDDVKVLSFIDTKYFRPGVKIVCECENVEYTENSLVIITSHTRLLSKLVSMVNTGLKPKIIIATTPALSENDLKLKVKLLEYDFPVVITNNVRGGPHIAGVLLNYLFKQVITE